MRNEIDRASELYVLALRQRQSNITFHYNDNLTRSNLPSLNEICHRYHRQLIRLLLQRIANLAVNITIIIGIRIDTWVKCFFSNLVSSFEMRKKANRLPDPSPCEEEIDRKRVQVARACPDGVSEWQKCLRRLILLIACVDRCRPVGPKSVLSLHQPSIFCYD